MQIDNINLDLSVCLILVPCFTNYKDSVSSILILDVLGPPLIATQDTDGLLLCCLSLFEDHVINDHDPSNWIMCVFSVRL